MTFQKILIKGVLPLFFVGILAASLKFPVEAKVQPQSKCEQEWCVCVGFTPAMLEEDENNATYEWDGDPISSDCFEWFHIWRKYNNSDREQFLAMAQASCDSCNPQEPGEVPEETATIEPMIVPELPEVEDLTIEATPGCVPFKEPGDLDCDGIPDDEDLCRATPGTSGSCGCGTIIAGDLVFRAGAASWVTTGPVGDFDFGHVAMYTGDIEVDSSIRNLHSAGVTILTYDAEQEKYVKTTHKDSKFSNNTIVVDSIIEADGQEHLDGVYVSNMKNLIDNHNTWSGATLDNLAIGQDPAMTCGQREEAVQYMMFLAELREFDGANYQLFNSANCANYVLKAYRSTLGDNYLTDIDKAFYSEFWPLSPNLLSRQLYLYNLNGKSVYRPDEVSSVPVIKIGTNMGAGRYNFNDQNSPSDHNISWRVNAPANQNNAKPLLTIYDGAGNTSGETSAGVVAEVPGSEVFAHDDLPTVINVVGQNALLIQVNVESAADFELVIHAENYPSPGQTITILYPKTPLESNAEFQVELNPTALDPESLAMYVFRDGSTNSEDAIVPTVKTGEIDYQTSSDPASDSSAAVGAKGNILPGGLASQAPWLLIPGALCFGASALVLVIGLMAKNRKVKIAGLILVLVVICLAMTVAAVYFGSMFL